MRYYSFKRIFVYMGMVLTKLRKISDSLTETELEPAREILAIISTRYPNGFKPLLLKVPKEDDPILFEYKLSEAVVELMLSLREKYPEGNVALAICYKFLRESVRG